MARGAALAIGAGSEAVTVPASTPRSRNRTLGLRLVHTKRPRCRHRPIGFLWDGVMTIRTMILGLAAGTLAAGVALAAIRSPRLRARGAARRAARPDRRRAVCACRVAPRRVVRVAPRRRVAAVWRRPRVVVEAPIKRTAVPRRGRSISATAPSATPMATASPAAPPRSPVARAATRRRGRSTWGPSWGPYNTDTVPAYGVGWF